MVVNKFYLFSNCRTSRTPVPTGWCIVRGVSCRAVACYRRKQGLGFYNTAGDKPPPYGFMRFLIVDRGCEFTRHPTATSSYHDPLHFIRRVILSKGAVPYAKQRLHAFPSGEGGAVGDG